MERAADPAADGADGSPAPTPVIDAHRLIGGVGVGVMVYDHHGRIVDANPAALELIGFELDAIRDRDLQPPRPLSIRPDGTPVPLDELPVREALRTGRPTVDQVVGIRRPDGSLGWVLVSARPLVDGESLRGAVVTLQDHTDRRDVERAERTVRRAGRVLVRAVDEQTLLQQMCDTVVEVGGYSLAWVARAEDDASCSVSQLAAAGVVDYLRPGFVTWAADDPRGRGPTGTCLREGGVRVADDYSVGTDLGPWNRRARAYGFGSGVSIPFTLGGGERGALCIYATDIHAFDRRAISLLEDLAGDLEFGLRHLRTSDALAASEERYRLLAENTGDVVLLTRDDRIEWASPSALSAFGWAPEELLGRPISEFAHPDEDEVRARLRRDSARGVRDTYRGRVRRKDGTWVWVDVRTRPVLGPDGRPDGSIISTVWDITAEVTAQVALEHAASHDSLTGVANRSLLLDELARALAAGHRSGTHVAVLLVDLDHFKYVNDSLGHAVGDELLCAAAERMHHAVREGDLVARQGGDEFVVVMRDLPDAAEAVVVAERLLEAFRRPITAGGAELFTTASIGVAVAEGADQDGIDLLREADTAMYRAKAEGRDRVSMFNEDLRDTAAQRLQIANELRTAVDRGELEVWYQPEVSLADGHLLAVEALLRWHHPSGATHPAGYFIDTAEETGMILDIGRWVLQEACRQGARWLATHPQRPLAVRVNISSLQLAEAGLLDDLDRALEGAGLAPERLCLEITETAMLHETSTVRANMAGIHHRGVRVAIDDFGTGYASLTYLRRYPIDVVKLDRSFVANLTTRPQDEHIVAGIIDLATRLGITVTAEGVEHEDQADRLHQLGCHSAQGYLYSRAVPPAAIDAVLDVELRPS